MGGNKERKSVGMIFICADFVDILLMLLGTLGAIGDGMSTNCLLLFVSRLFNSLGYGSTGQSHGNFMNEVDKVRPLSSILVFLLGPQSLASIISLVQEFGLGLPFLGPQPLVNHPWAKFCLYFVYLGLGVMVVAFMEGYCWSKTSERQVLKIRYKYLEAILRQEVGYFDSQETTTSEIVDSIAKDTSLIQEVLSEKVPKFVMHTSQFVSGIAFSMYFSWRLCLVAFPTIIFLVIPGIIYGKYLLYLSNKSFKEYGKANAIVEQALSSIKTVYASTAEKNMVERYSRILDETTRIGLKKGFAKGLAVGSTGLSFAIWAFLAWYGSRLVLYKGESGGQIYTAGITFVLAGLSLGVALPEVKYLTEASVAASHIFDRINRIPEINGEDTRGIILENIRGELEFKNVKFTYPSRPDSIVLNDFNLRIEAGKTVALVGASGSGKSTAIALLQRFYDADGGVVRFDGADIKRMQLKWLRGQMGLVSQEHSLFGTSIKENIMFGKLDASMDEVVAAAKAANAHSFISQLPEGYETKVGERGGLLSGGQKQRISIARAIVKNPVILLLDEATSALDSESETLVQNALDQASMGRTTLVVAHKLSTVINADVIAVMSGGCIIEAGSHNDLVNRKNGHYAKLAKLQRQFSSADQDQQHIESRVSSMARSSAGSLSTSKSSPAVFATLLPGDFDARTISYPPPSFSRLISMNSSEWKQGLIGSLSAMVFGAIQPVYALTIGGMISAFFLPSHEEMRTRIRTYALIFCALSILSIVVNLLQNYNFSYMGEQLAKRIRLKMLEKVLTFEAAWFDEEKNSSGALCARLSNEASMVKSLVADRVSLLVQTISAVVVAMIMGLVVAWKLALVMIAVQPLTILCFYTRNVLLSSVSTNFIKAQNESTQIAVEAVHNHRIVTSFGSIRKVLGLFYKAQNEPRREGRKKAWLAGIGMGSAQCLTFMCWALDFWYGGRLVSSGEISAGDVFKTFFILVSTGKVIAEAGSMTSDIARGSTAVASVFAILDRQSLITASNTAGDGSKLEKLAGGIDIREVDFAYPRRPDCQVLCQFCLEVKAGSSIGLVGKSGCGKSTVIALIQRFYDVEKGAVKVDGMDIRSLDIGWYRRQMALVSQEPVIYSGSIRDNIVFGKLDASETDIVEAARAANAHEFISSLKDGYETECGERGVQLSGGQKQRIAIARAIIRKPTILLLDEATSALDVLSEQVVQEALDRIMVGRTTLVVAHRLNTIKNLDSIAVVADGKVVERGTFAQLKNRRGAFFNLGSIQKT